jgi:hypothetical protein
MEPFGEWLARIGWLWVDGSIVILAAAINSEPFLIAGIGIAGPTYFLVKRDTRRRPGADRRVTERGRSERSSGESTFTVR